MRAGKRAGLALSIIVNSACWAAEVAAPISEVILYPGSATIERSALVSPGMTQLEVKGLPSGFDIQTLRVQADAGIQLGQIVTQDIGRSEAANEREAAIEAKIEALDDRMTVLDVEARSAALVQGFLENLGSKGNTPGDKQPLALDARSMGGLIESIRRGASDALERIQRVGVQKREINKQKEALQRDLARLRGGSRDLRNLTVKLSASKAGSIRITYQVNGAGWKPAYRASLDSQSSTVELERLAAVSQKTGEDWSDVRLRLSTGQPRLSPQAQEPRPWLLSYRKPLPAQAESRTYAAAPVPAPLTSLAKSRSAESDSYSAPTIETEGNFASEFEVPARVTLPSDGREVSLTLTRQRIAVKQHVRVTPRLDKNAVVLAEAERPSGVWLSGNIQLFRDGSYVGATQWNTQLSERLRLPFGRDDLIRVTVDRLQEFSGTTGLLTQHSERRIADSYTLTSFHKSPIDILVLESSPVSSSDEVKVEASYTLPPTVQTWDKRQGVVAWEKTLAPQETLKIDISYRIVFPKEGSVAGLP